MKKIFECCKYTVGIQTPTLIYLFTYFYKLGFWNCSTSTEKPLVIENMQLTDI